MICGFAGSIPARNCDTCPARYELSPVKIRGRGFTPLTPFRCFVWSSAAKGVRKLLT